MISLIQIIIIVFAIFAWSRVIIRLSKKDISVGEFFLWSMIWVAVIVVGIAPQIIQNLSERLGLFSALNLVVYISIIALLYLVFRLYVKFEQQQKEITRLVREVAIKDVKLKKSNKK